MTAEDLTPLRAPGSVRRTSTLELTWPEGPGGPLAVVGRSRDALTDVCGSLRVVADDRLEVRLDEARTVTAASLPGLVGDAVGPGFRRRAAAFVGQAPGGGLHQLVDDLPVFAVIADFAWRQWRDDDRVWSLMDERAGRRVAGTCTGFAPGSSALNPDGSSTGDHRVTEVSSLARVDDPEGWHVVPYPLQMAMRRARRMDVSHLDHGLRIDAMFQDSSNRPVGPRVAVHEYRMSVVVDERGSITAIEAQPGNLPYAECPVAALGVTALLGVQVAQLRAEVPTRLKGIKGCTHLNDALRALADVPHLAALAS